jgi:type I restriction enzyme R subunit
VQTALGKLDQSLLAGGAPALAELVPHLKKHGPKAAREMFKAAPKLLERLAELAETVGLREKLYISTHPDKLIGVTIGYGKDKDGKAIVKPQDYLEHFNDFIRNNLNQVAALQIVATKPRSLTRADLRALATLLDNAGFGEAKLQKAWHDVDNVEIAATLVGYVRKAALGDALEPFATRVDRAIGVILKSQKFSPNQENALRFIADRVKHAVVIDDELWRSPPVRERYGPRPLERLNKIFDGEFEPLIDQFADQLWVNQA